MRKSLKVRNQELEELNSKLRKELIRQAHIITDLKKGKKGDSSKARK